MIKEFFTGLTVLNAIGKTLLIMLSGLVAYFQEIHPLIILVTVLVSTDFFTKLFIVIKTGGFKNFDIDFLWKDVVRLLCYLIALVIVFMSEKTLIGDTVLLTKIVCAMLVAAEIATIFKNLGTITNEQSLFLRIYNAIKKQINVKNTEDDKEGKDI